LDVNTQAWTTITNSSPTSGEAAVIYGKDVIYKAGGYQFASPATTTKELYKMDLAAPSPSWTAMQPSLHHCAEFHLTALPDGKLLASGGDFIAEQYDPAANTWSDLATMFQAVGSGRPVGHHAATILLPDGRVLVTGGQPTNSVDPCAKPDNLLLE